MEGMSALEMSAISTSMPCKFGDLNSGGPERKMDGQNSEITKLR